MFTKDGIEVTELKWTAPTENTDGSPITQSLSYTLYTQILQTWSAIASFPGTLNPDGTYVFPLADVAAFSEDKAYTLTLTATDEDGDESDRSGSIVITRAMAPKAPADFGAQ